MAFTNWSTYLAELKDSLVGHAWRHRSYATPTGGSVTFSSLSELQQHIEWVERQVSKDDRRGSSVVIARTNFPGSR